MITPIAETIGSTASITPDGIYRRHYHKVNSGVGLCGSLGVYRRRYYISDGTTDIFGNLVYTGYFETAPCQDATFTINNLTVTGFKSPPPGGPNNNGMLEPDVNYGVILNPSWLTTCSAPANAKLPTGVYPSFGTSAVAPLITGNVAGTSNQSPIIGDHSGTSSWSLTPGKP